MTHHCKNRELTVAMAARYDLDEKQVSFVTGSGEDTNKVGSIVEDARRLREELAVEHAGGAFDGESEATGIGEDPAGDADGDTQSSLEAGSEDGDGDAAGEGSDTDTTGEKAGTDATADDETEPDDQQSGLSDFV